AEPGPAALRRADDAVERAERIEYALVAAMQAHRCALGDIERNRTEVAGAVEHRNHHRRLAFRERRDGVGEPRVIVVMRHADDGNGPWQTEGASDVTRAARRRVELRRVHHRRIAGAEQAQARWKFFQD